MSHGAYNQLWREAQAHMNGLLALELSPESLAPPKDLVAYSRQQASLFIHYVQILRKLDLVYDQLANPQKRRLVRTLLDGVMGRILELRKEMVQRHLSEFIYMDDAIQDLKLTPADFDIPIPKYFVNERARVKAERKKLFSQFMEETLKEDTAVLTVGLTKDEAVRVIQIGERARQGRLRAAFMREIWREEQRERRAKLLGLVTMDPSQAATQIQKLWKGHKQRKITQELRAEELIFLGMVPGPEVSQVSEAQKKAKEVREARHSLQQEYEKEYMAGQAVIKQIVLNTEGPDIKESMKDQIRQWFIECFNATGKFPDYPDVEQGGSTLIFAEKSPEQLLHEMAEEEAQKEAERLEREKEAKKGVQDKNAKAQKPKKKKKAKGDDTAPATIGNSQFLVDIRDNSLTFDTVWRPRNLSNNYDDRYIKELEKEVKRKEVENEIRLQVDELMKEELKSLKLAVERDSGAPPVKRKARKKGKEKGGKKKKDKDLTAGRTLESLCMELIEQGILKEVHSVPLADYVGDYSYLGTTLIQSNIEPMPSLFDIKQLITMYAVLPLGSQALHERAPLVKSILLVGPVGVGKKTLVHAICTETCATLFDLSVNNVANKYPGKSGLQMMLHMVFKVARLLQPSVVWLGNAEKNFYKKVPKEEKELDPKRMRKELPKVLKSIKPADRVLLVGTTNRPFDAMPRLLFKTYERIIMVPRPDYSSRFAVWKHLIQSKGGVVTSELDLSSLAKVSDGYTPGRMVQVVNMVLTEQRLRQQTKKPLTTVDFILPLAKMEPVYQGEEEAFKRWYNYTPLGKQRLKQIREALKEEQPGKDKDKKGKKPVKKK